MKNRKIEEKYVGVMKKGIKELGKKGSKIL